MREHEWVVEHPNHDSYVCKHCGLVRMVSSYIRAGYEKEKKYTYFWRGDLLLGRIPDCNEALMRRVLG